MCGIFSMSPYIPAPILWCTLMRLRDGFIVDFAISERDSLFAYYCCTISVFVKFPNLVAKKLVHLHAPRCAPQPVS